MEDQLELLASEYRDLYTAPSEERNSELDFKVAELEWEGLYLAAPAKVDAAVPGIPILAMTRRNDLREWEARLRKNSAVVFTDLERGTTGMRPLHNPPVKKMKPQPDTRGRKPGPDEGFTAGAIRQVIGDALPEPLPQGNYAVALIAWDLLSNQRLVRKEGKPIAADPAASAAAWPWERWSDTRPFLKGPASPAVAGQEGAALKIEGQKADRIILGAVAAKARPVHVIAPNPKRAANAEIQAGIHVYLLLFSLDKYPPESEMIPVPILGSVPIRVGESMKGWFTLPFPFQPSAEDRMLYAVADGMVIGPVKVPGEKP